MTESFAIWLRWLLILIVFNGALIAFFRWHNRKLKKNKFDNFLLGLCFVLLFIGTLLLFWYLALHGLFKDMRLRDMLDQQAISTAKIEDGCAVKPRTGFDT